MHLYEIFSSLYILHTTFTPIGASEEKRKLAAEGISEEISPSRPGTFQEHYNGNGGIFPQFSRHARSICGNQKSLQNILPYNKITSRKLSSQGNQQYFSKCPFSVADRKYSKFGIFKNGLLGNMFSINNPEGSGCCGNADNGINSSGYSNSQAKSNAYSRGGFLSNLIGSWSNRFVQNGQVGSLNANSDAQAHLSNSLNLGGNIYGSQLHSGILGTGVNQGLSYLDETQRQALQNQFGFNINNMLNSNTYSDINQSFHSKNDSQFKDYSKTQFGWFPQIASAQNQQGYGDEQSHNSDIWQINSNAISNNEKLIGGLHSQSDYDSIQSNAGGRYDNLNTEKVKNFYNQQLNSMANSAFANQNYSSMNHLSKINNQMGFTSEQSNSEGNDQFSSTKEQGAIGEYNNINTGLNFLQNSNININSKNQIGESYNQGDYTSNQWNTAEALDHTSNNQANRFGQNHLVDGLIEQYNASANLYGGFDSQLNNKYQNSQSHSQAKKESQKFNTASNLQLSVNAQVNNKNELGEKRDTVSNQIHAGAKIEGAKNNQQGQLLNAASEVHINSNSQKGYSGQLGPIIGQGSIRNSQTDTSSTFNNNFNSQSNSKSQTHERGSGALQHPNLQSMLQLNTNNRGENAGTFRPAFSDQEGYSDNKFESAKHSKDKFNSQSNSKSHINQLSNQSSNKVLQSIAESKVQLGANNQQDNSNIFKPQSGYGNKQMESTENVQELHKAQSNSLNEVERSHTNNNNTSQLFNVDTNVQLSSKNQQGSSDSGITETLESISHDQSAAENHERRSHSEENQSTHESYTAENSEAENHLGQSSNSSGLWDSQVSNAVNMQINGNSALESDSLKNQSNNNKKVSNAGSKLVTSSNTKFSYGNKFNQTRQWSYSSSKQSNSSRSEKKINTSKIG